MFSNFKAYKQETVSNFELQGGETQLTDAIQELVTQKRRVFTIKLEKERCLDIGKAENYLEAITLSYRKLRSA